MTAGAISSTVVWMCLIVQTVVNGLFLVAGGAAVKGVVFISGTGGICYSDNLSLSVFDTGCNLRL